MEIKFQLVSPLMYVENQMELMGHSQVENHSPNSHLYCDDLYCNWFGFGQEWTLVDSISQAQCMDMCLCDADCKMFYWAEYVDICFDLNTQTPTSCTMCRIYHTSIDANDPLVGFSNVGYDGDVISSAVGAKDASFFTTPSNNCQDPAVCENPSSHSSSSSLEPGEDSTCEEVAFPDSNGEDFHA